MVLFFFSLGGGGGGGAILLHSKHRRQNNNPHMLIPPCMISGRRAKISVHSKPFFKPHCQVMVAKVRFGTIAFQKTNYVSTFRTRNANNQNLILVDHKPMHRIK